MSTQIDVVTLRDTVPKPPKSIKASRTINSWLAVLTILMIGMCLVLGVHLHYNGLQGVSIAAGGAAPNPGALANGPVVRKAWGQLELIPIVISPPLELVPEAGPLKAVMESTEVAWHFPDTDTLQLAERFSEIGLSEGLSKSLMSMAEMDRDINGLIVRPTRETVLGLSRNDRSALYVLLAEFDRNSEQRNAFRKKCASPAEWFENCLVSAETRQLVEPLIYRYGDYQFFADLLSIESQLPSAEQRQRLVQMLASNSTFLVKLEVSENADIDRLVNYWGRGGREKEVRPLLESLSKIPGGQSVDVSRLLPPFAQSRIYTHPAVSDLDVTGRRDCHWTALNFFNEVPDDRLCDPSNVPLEFQANYYRVHGNLQLGDIMVLIDVDAVGVHSSVFIAEDLYFTKYGSVSSHPWMISTADEIKQYYPRHGELKVRYYRHRRF